MAPEAAGTGLLLRRAPDGRTLTLATTSLERAHVERAANTEQRQPEPATPTLRVQVPQNFQLTLARMPLSRLPLPTCPA